MSTMLVHVVYGFSAALAVGFSPLLPGWDAPSRDLRHGAHAT